MVLSGGGGGRGDGLVKSVGGPVDNVMHSPIVENSLLNQFTFVPLCRLTGQLKGGQRGGPWNLIWHSLPPPPPP